MRVERGDDVVIPAVRIDCGSDKLLLLPLLALVVDAVIASSRNKSDERRVKRCTTLMEAFLVVDSVWYDNDGMETTELICHASE